VKVPARSEIRRNFLGSSNLRAIGKWGGGITEEKKVDRLRKKCVFAVVLLRALRGQDRCFLNLSRRHEEESRAREKRAKGGGGKLGNVRAGFSKNEKTN